MDTTQQLTKQIASAYEATWYRIGVLSDLLNEPEKACASYENSLRHNPFNYQALINLGNAYKAKEQYPKAIEFYLRALDIDNTKGEVWGDLAFSYLMTDDVHKSHSAYEKAINMIPYKCAKIWYGLGLLYDKLGSVEHAIEAFLAVINIQPVFEKINDVYYRLGLLYKQQQKFEQSLVIFNRIVSGNTNNGPNLADVWFHIGHTYELQKEFDLAIDSYNYALVLNPNHLKVLQQLGWIYHNKFEAQDQAIHFLNRATAIDNSDGQSWYILGRCHMAQRQYNKAYDAYQQAVYRDVKNPTFWCSIGVLYHQLNQQRDALSAYTKALNLNPYLSEVWFNLGTLYESCKQYPDSLDAFQRALELEPANEATKERIQFVKSCLGHSPNEQKPSTTQNNNLNNPNYNGIAALAKISCELENE